MKDSGIRMQRSLRLLLGLLPSLFLLSPALPAQTGGSANTADVMKSPVGAAPVWQRDLPGAVSGLPFLQAESVVVAIDHGVIRSYSRQGTLLWDFNPRSSVTPYIARSPEGTTYVCNTAGSLMAINRVGRELWRLELEKPIAFPVVIGWDGRVFIPIPQEISCRTASGLTLWRLNPGSPLSLAPVPDHAGGIATVLENRDFLRVDQFGAVERIRLDRTPALVVPLKSGEQNSYFLIYINGETEEIRLNSAANPGAKLSRSRRPTLPAAPAAAAGREDLVAVTLQNGRVLLLPGGGGQIRWTGHGHDTAEERGPGAVTPGEVSMIFDERGIFVLSPRGATAFAAGGRRRWLFRTPEATGIPALSDEGLLYVCGNDRNIRIYKVDNQVRNIPRSMYGPDPEGSYGLGNPPPSPWVNNPDRFDEKELAVMFERIDSAAKNGQVGENETAYTAYLMEMTAGILNNPNYSPVRPPIRVPQRVELIRLLGRMGSRETIPFLANLFYRDPEPSIKAACCEAIGRIGVDPKGDAIRAYSVLLSPDNANLDPMTLIAAASSAAALARFSGPPLAVASIRLLMAFGHMDFPPRVKRQARQELEALRKEGLDKPIE
ncbi:MAG: PQQ-binding-like beta-propeller repeat protein [Spirochaetaceae bacterium]|jgi:outer membrane protein assembly factor BamB|nr:PQQ-binding-like beta-propeller repeat protein [Spirochaetaceae bacterium]